MNQELEQSTQEQLGRHEVGALKQQVGITCPAAEISGLLAQWPPLGSLSMGPVWASSQRGKRVPRAVSQDCKVNVCGIFKVQPQNSHLTPAPVFAGRCHHKISPRCTIRVFGVGDVVVAIFGKCNIPQYSSALFPNCSPGLSLLAQSKGAPTTPRRPGGLPEIQAQM